MYLTPRTIDVLFPNPPVSETEATVVRVEVFIVATEQTRAIVRDLTPEEWAALPSGSAPNSKSVDITAAYDGGYIQAGTSLFARVTAFSLADGNASRDSSAMTVAAVLTPPDAPASVDLVE